MGVLLEKASPPEAKPSQTRSIAVTAACGLSGGPIADGPEPRYALPGCVRRTALAAGPAALTAASDVDC
jgi:hypothetical protein